MEHSAKSVTMLDSHAPAEMPNYEVLARSEYVIV